MKDLHRVGSVGLTPTGCPTLRPGRRDEIERMAVAFAMS
jgi:hypothetical protein